MLQSNWSDPVLIRRHENVTSECTFKKSRGSPATANFVAWWEFTVPIIIVVVLAIVLVIVIVSVLLIRNHRNRMDMKKLLLVSIANTFTLEALKIICLYFPHLFTETSNNDTYPTAKKNLPS